MSNDMNHKEVKSGNNQLLPLALGLGIVITSIVIYRFYNGSSCKAKSKSKKVLLKDSQTKYSVSLIEKTAVSHDTRKFKFALPEKDMVLGLPICQHIRLSTRINNEPVIRYYSPISSNDDEGFMELIVKIYFSKVNPKFPEGGKMSQYLESLKINDKIEIQGPVGRVQYLDNGKFSIKKTHTDPPNIINVKRVGLIAGGSGITPILQLIRHITKNLADPTECALVYANKTEDDILVRKELEEVATQHPNRFKLWYTIDKPGPEWKYSSGHINEEILRKHLFPPSKDTLILLCGPPGMINSACMPNLEKIGHDKELCVCC